ACGCGSASNACRQEARVSACSCARPSPESPAVSARYRATPPAAAAKRASRSIFSEMIFGSVSTAIGQRNIACLAAIGTVIEAIGAEANFSLTLANGAVLFAGALRLRLVALHADNGTWHRCLREQCT